LARMVTISFGVCPDATVVEGGCGGAAARPERGAAAR